MLTAGDIYRHIYKLLLGISTILVQFDNRATSSVKGSQSLCKISDFQLAAGFLFCHGLLSMHKTNATLKFTPYTDIN
jgi:hypothetical protein